VGLDHAGNGNAVNRGTILGGEGAGLNPVNYFTGGAGGAAVTLGQNARMTNFGTINGGAGGQTGQHTRYSDGGAGGAGVSINGGRLVDYGTIAGGAGGNGPGGVGATGDAVQFGALAGTLVVESHAVFLGDVVANSGVADTLELAGSQSGSLTGLGTTITGFTNITEDAHCQWILSGKVTGTGTLSLGAGAHLTVAGAISIAKLSFTAGDSERLESTGTISSLIFGFGTGDKIELTGIAATSLKFAAGTLDLLEGTGIVATLYFTGDYSAADFTLKESGSNSTISYTGTPAAHAAIWPTPWEVHVL